MGLKEHHMTPQQLEAYRLMYKALDFALHEIHNPGANRAGGFDIVGHIEQVRQLAERVSPEKL
jgi:hypothetical protein